jgi:hypothetical protein
MSDTPSTRSSTRERRFWIAVASQDHVDAAVAGGYVEINHGKATPLERMRAGDGIAWYSPRTRYPDGEVLQAFTALGRITDAPMYQRPDLHQPFRRGAQWFPTVTVPIRPLLEALGFIHSKTSWGAAFRYGFLRVPREDFARIARAMGCPFDEMWPAAQAPDAAPAQHARRRGRTTAAETVDA